MKIKRVEIEGFRAYKYKADGTFDFTNDGDKPSNFVAIYAPNGFGKSSFYDAVEWAVTNHLDRLGGAYNKKNHEFAAKSTKENGVGQKILRNKDVADNIITHVKVSTTRPMPFERKIKTIRSDSRDIRIGDNKKKENEYFRKVILSQDEIDRFLKEAKPQDRYKIFMESFGGDAELARQEITVLINDNKSVLEDLERKRAELEEKLKEPVDASVFEKFNLVASELNAEGENIPLVDSDFSVNKEHEILSLLVTRTHELKMLREARAKTRELLIEKQLQLPELRSNLDIIAKHQPELDILSKGVADAQAYETLVASHEKCLSDLQVVSKKLEKLLEVNDLAHEFFRTDTEIAIASEKKKEFSKRRSDEVALLAGLEESARKIKQKLNTDEARSSFLRDTIDNCGATFSEIAAHQGRIAVINSQISEKDVSLSLDKSHRDSLEKELLKVSDVKVSVQSLLTSDLGAINFERYKLQELGDLAEELNVLELHDQTIKNTQKSLNDQMGLHERLITTGLEYLSLWPTSTCPLCQKSHESALTLKEKVEANDLLSELSKDNSKKLEDSAKLQSDLKIRMESIAQEALAVQMKQLAELRRKLNEIGAKIYKIEQEKSVLSSEKESLVEKVVTLQQVVWGLSKHELIQRVESELETLTVKIGEYTGQNYELNLQVEKKISIIEELDSSINLLNLRIEAMASNSAYQMVGSYLHESGLSSGNLKTHCSTRILELERLEKEFRVNANEAQYQAKILQYRMLDNGTWIDTNTLLSQKEQAEKHVAKSRMFVESFFLALKQMVGSQTDKTVSEAEFEISKSIDGLFLQCRDIDGKREKGELLLELLKSFKPYLASLSLKDSLVDVERSLFQHRRIDAILEHERKLAVEELRRLVNTFFYEDLINSIYKKIDPHPLFRKVEFRPDFESSDRPGLNVVLNDEAGEVISPVLYFSAAQLNILSLSVFLAGALHAKDDDGFPLDVIMIDDPIQSMDSINVLATIDLLRSLSVRFDKQIIISTHDDNFFGLLQRKIPSEALGSKFIRLEKFGVAVPVEPMVN